MAAMSSASQPGGGVSITDSPYHLFHLVLEYIEEMLR
jgi:hypothetical protein